ncbi:MAG: hypothetical protein RIQ81_468 [Pseudomonadota bacterium]|jgi:uncharacterized protein (DUF58 family)
MSKFPEASPKASLSPEVLRQIRRLELRAGRAVTDVMAGQYVSVFKGRGMEFDEVREYVAGDDVRLIDWNVTARLNVPHIKILREERELTVLIVCDVSASQAFQGFHRPKREVAAEMAAVLAFLASRSQDRVGLVLASDEVEEFVPPRKGRGHVWNLIREVLTYKSKGSGTGLDGALRFVDQVQKRRALVFVLSDFLGGFPATLGQVARQHDVVAIRICDPLEREVPRGAGLVEVTDAESGQAVVVDADDDEFRTNFHRWWQTHDEQFFAWVRRSGAKSFDAATSADTVDPLAAFLRGAQS